MFLDCHHLNAKPTIAAITSPTKRPPKNAPASNFPPFGFSVLGCRVAEVDEVVVIVDDELVLGPVDAFVGFITEVVTVVVVVEALGVTAVIEASLSKICPDETSLII